MKRFLCVAVALICALSCATAAKKLETKKLMIHTANGKAVSVRAELARTAAEHQHGFMERTSIPDGTGMLFVFKADQQLHFWMKDTPHPLSIAYIDRNGTIRDIFDMKPYSLATVSSTVSVRYALEVPQGWFERAGISIGDTLDLDF